MLADLLFTLAATPTNRTSDDAVGAIVFLVIALAVAVVVRFAYYNKERQRRIDAEARLGQAYSMRREQDEKSAERDNIMFSQHKQMNDLQIAKLTAEVELLQNQVKSKALDEDRIEA